MTLLNGVSRCNDVTCNLRETCARWTDRQEGRVHATFRRGLLPCCSFEPIREPEPDPAQGSLF